MGVELRMLTGRVALRVGSRVALLAVVTLLALGCAGRAELIRGEPAGKDLDGLVDSDSARQVLVDLLARRSLEPRLEALAPSPLPADAVWKRGANASTAQRWLPDQARLLELSREKSVDFAALTFARAMRKEAMSREVQASFDRFLHDDAARSAALLRLPGAFPYTVLFAPSWLYRSHPETGADFAHQRLLLDRLGLANRLIVTGESASIEDNAAAIAAALRAARPEDGSLILVTASKSGGGGAGLLPLARAGGHRPGRRLGQHRGRAGRDTARRFCAAPAHLVAGPLRLLAEWLGLGGPDLDGDEAESRPPGRCAPAGIDYRGQRGGRAALGQRRRDGLVGLQVASSPRPQ